MSGACRLDHLLPGSIINIKTGPERWLTSESSACGITDEAPCVLMAGDSP